MTKAATRHSSRAKPKPIGDNSLSDMPLPNQSISACLARARSEAVAIAAGDKGTSFNISAAISQLAWAIDLLAREIYRTEPKELPGETVVGPRATVKPPTTAQ